MNNAIARNRLTYGLGTVGRDMVYALVSMYLIFYFTDVVKVSTGVMWWVAGIIFVIRIFDTVLDPIMGNIVDNTHTKWGKFKPWIAIGAVFTAVFTLILFTGLWRHGGVYIAVFAVVYLMWGISFAANDISYWSMLPSLSIDQKEREKIGAIARICANIGLFFVVAGIVPLTELLGKRFGSLQNGYFIFASLVTIVMLSGQCVTLFGVKEAGIIVNDNRHTPLRDLFRVIFKNDQLFFIALAMSLFMVGYVTTASFGLYFFKYAYGDEHMYPIFALILGVSQITALAIFPLLSSRFTRENLFTTAVILTVSGYLIFFFAPVNTFVFIGIASVLLFVGQSFVQLLMLMFLADTVDYGHWKLGKRNSSITFSIQPFVNKLAGAISSGVVAIVIIVSGIKDAGTAAGVTDGGLLLMKIAMLIFPLICIVASFVIYRNKYRIDSKFYAQILADLRDRGEIR